MRLFTLESTCQQIFKSDILLERFREDTLATTRVKKKEEESVEHASEPNCSESNVTSAKAHVM